MSLDHDTLAQFVASVRRFVDERLIPRESEVADADAMPADVVEEMRKMGLFGLSIAPEYGGLGLTMEEEAMVIFEIGRAAPAFRSIFATNVGIGSQGIAIDGTPEQKARYLPLLASGALIGSFALTEPETGSDAGSLRTTARREGDSYVLNGTKRYITNAPHSGVCPYRKVAVLTPDARRRGRRIGLGWSRRILRPASSLGQARRKKNGPNRCACLRCDL